MYVHALALALAVVPCYDAIGWVIILTRPVPDRNNLQCVEWDVKRYYNFMLLYRTSTFSLNLSAPALNVTSQL